MKGQYITSNWVCSSSTQVSSFAGGPRADNQLLAPAVRLLLSITTSRAFRPGKLVLLLHVLSLAGSLVIYRWFKLISTPRMGERGVKAGEDLGGGGIVELAWDA